MNIAIDGPAGAGKSTVAKILAKKLNYNYIDTGAMYRALTLKAIQEGVDFNNTNSLVSLLETTKIEIIHETVFLDGKDVTSEIRTPEVDQKVSITAAVPEIRKEMVNLQRRMAKNTNVIMDGRDIGTVVLPDANFKFFVTASEEERAKRRFKELTDKNYEVDYEYILKEISKRDKLDTKRKVSPLKQADDAIIINTNNKTIEEVVQEILSYIKGEAIM
ncbi:MAG TPA: (d)CMP kinase [Thermoanaerobacterales bacterium]|nr:(d)CMP kinase [Thermoanaerobacterales bacterium]